MMTACMMLCAETAKPKIFEAEDVLVGQTLQINDSSHGCWDLWTTDPNAAKTWSGGKVIRGRTVKGDWIPMRNDSSVLAFRIPVEQPGTYDVTADLPRAIGVSTDGGRTWRKFFDYRARIVPARQCEKGDTIEFLVAGCFVHRGNVGCPYIDTFRLMKSTAPAPRLKTFAGLPDGTVYFEAEDVLTGDEVPRNRPSADGWDLWTTDPNAAKIWSMGGVLRGAKVTKDEKPGSGGSRILEFRIPVREEGIYDVIVGLPRAVGFSFDGGKTWEKRIGPRIRIIHARSYKAGDKIEFLASGCFVTEKSPGTPYLDVFALVPLSPVPKGSGK